VIAWIIGVVIANVWKALLFILGSHLIGYVLSLPFRIEHIIKVLISLWVGATGIIIVWLIRGSLWWLLWGFFEITVSLIILTAIVVFAFFAKIFIPKEFFPFLSE